MKYRVYHIEEKIRSMTVKAWEEQILCEKQVFNTPLIQCLIAISSSLFLSGATKILEQYLVCS